MGRAISPKVRVGGCGRGSLSPSPTLYEPGSENHAGGINNTVGLDGVGGALFAGLGTRRVSMNHSLIILVSLSQSMFQGVLRDEERRREKMRVRQAEYEMSVKKRGPYEGVHRVDGSPEGGQQ